MSSISFKPVYMGDSRLTNRVSVGSFTTFICDDPLGYNVSEIRVPLVALQVETVTGVPSEDLLASGYKDKNTYDFRHILGVNPRHDVSCAWAAFCLLINWLSTGSYDNDEEVDATHIDAYLLSEKLQSPRFGNAVMLKLLKQIPTMKENGQLAGTIRRLIEEATENSLLKKLFYDIAVWWFPPGRYLNGTKHPKYFEGAGFFLPIDDCWLNVLESHNRETCHCSPAKRRKGHVDWAEDLDLEPVGCRAAPWLDHPSRYMLSK